MTIKVDLLHSERRSRWRLDPLMLVLFALVLATNVAFAFYGQRLDASIGARQDEVREVQAEQRQVEASLPVIEERRARVARLARRYRPSGTWSTTRCATPTCSPRWPSGCRSTCG